jgi:hypothetical protein
VGRRWIAAAAAAALLAPSSGAAQGRSKDAETCPWCKDDPALMQAAGVLSHGPIAIGPEGSQTLAAKLVGPAWRFAETAHLRFASSLADEAIDMKDRARVEAELARLREALPSIPMKLKRLDPWLRLHLFAMKGEELYARFQRLLGVTDADFPEERTAEGPFMGAGRYLGEKDKFEVVLHRARATHTLFTGDFSGIRVTDSLRWHFPGQHKLLASVPAEDSDLREDRWLWPHVAHNLSHLFFCGYKHFSYDPPIWLDEGLALAIEKEAEPASTTREGEEGSERYGGGPSDWNEAARKLVARGKAPRLAELMSAKGFSELDDDANVAAWSIVRFLLDEHGEAFARFLGGIKGQLDAAGYPSGADLGDLQRRLLRELWGWSPADLDAAWTAWVLARE